MIEYLLTFTPRLVFNKEGWASFRIQKRSVVKEFLDDTKEDLAEHEILCSIIKTKNHNKHIYTLQIYGEDVFRFLDLVNDFKGGKEWKQICARKIRQMAETRKNLRRNVRI